MKKRVFTAVLCLTMILSISMIPANAATAGLHNFKKTQSYTTGQFADVPANNTFAKNIQTAYEYGVMNGSSANVFGVKDNITRLAAVIIACRLHSIYNTGTVNIDEEYSYIDFSLRYMLYAEEHGIYMPGGNIRLNATREEFAAILGSALPDEALPAINKVSDNAIPDVIVNTKNAKAVYRLYRAGVITGSDAKGTFYPNAFITRGAACAIATRMVDSALRKQITLDSRESLSRRGTVAVTPTEINIDNREATAVVSFMLGAADDYGSAGLSPKADYDSNVVNVLWGNWQFWTSDNGSEMMLPITLVPVANGETTVRIYQAENPNVCCEIHVTVSGRAK